MTNFSQPLLLIAIIGLSLIISGCAGGDDETTTETSAETLVETSVETSTETSTETKSTPYVFPTVTSSKFHYSVQLTAEQDGSNVVFTYMGGFSDDKLEGLKFNVNGTISSTGKMEVGETYTVYDVVKHTKERVMVIGLFDGGEEQIVMDMYV